MAKNIYELLEKTIKEEFMNKVIEKRVLPISRNLFYKEDYSEYEVYEAITDDDLLFQSIFEDIQDEYGDELEDILGIKFKKYLKIKDYDDVFQFIMNSINSIDLV